MMKQEIKEAVDKLSDPVGYDEYLDSICEEGHDQELEVPKWMRV